jgi:N-formylglutamate amidohydrolase
MADTNGPFTLFNAALPEVPVLLSVPHAGRDYPAELLSNLRVPVLDMLRLEDRYADRLVQPLISAGFPAIIAHRARAWIDLNRAENDIDLHMIAGHGTALSAVPSAKTRGGLGLIPRRLLVSGELWRQPLKLEELTARISSDHRPFHDAVGATLRAMRERFGIAILLDVHSMPPIKPRYAADDPPPQLVVGDRFGRSAASIYSELVIAHMQGHGFPVALNNPYSGDHILQVHGKPHDNVHALQLEVDRSLYLDSALREPSDELPRMARLVRDIAMLLADHAIGSDFAQAAE